MSLNSQHGLAVARGCQVCPTLDTAGSRDPATMHDGWRPKEVLETHSLGGFVPMANRRLY
eukprot:SAG11_NODE_21223_length_429_cov_1.184848_1_plen_59_part_10